jgi:hypothetical protein
MKRVLGLAILLLPSVYAAPSNQVIGSAMIIGVFFLGASIAVWKYLDSHQPAPVANIFKRSRPIPSPVATEPRQVVSQRGVSVQHIESILAKLEEDRNLVVGLLGELESQDSGTSLDDLGAVRDISDAMTSVVARYEEHRHYEPDEGQVALQQVEQELRGLGNDLYARYEPTIDNLREFYSTLSI